jgi:DNA-binding transcriptional LysR family regulator
VASLEWLLADSLAALLHRHPQIILDIAGTSFERGVQLLRNGGVDVAIGFEDAFFEWSDVKRTPIAALRAVVFARKGHPSPYPQLMTLQRLRILPRSSATPARQRSVNLPG